MRWLVGLGIVAAGIGTAIALHKSRRLGSNADPFGPTGDEELDPYGAQRDEPEWEGDCLILGKFNPKFSPGPYRVCLTHNQERKLFKGSRRKQKKLGCGVFACAYTSTNSSRVVKFTRDPEDVAALIKAQKTGVVPKLYDVYKLKQGGRTMPIENPFTYRKPAPQEVPVYALVVERLRTIPEEDQYAMNVVLPEIRAVAEGKVTGNDFCENLNNEDGSVGCDDVQLATVRAVEKLREAGITWGDIHAGNIGFDKKGKLKVLDLGFTSTELKRRIKILEGLGRASRISSFKLI